MKLFFSVIQIERRALLRSFFPLLAMSSLRTSVHLDSVNERSPLTSVSINMPRTVYSTKRGRWFFFVDEVTSFSEDAIAHTDHSRVCCFRSFNTKVISGRSIETTTFDTPSATREEIFWAWLVGGCFGRHRCVAGKMLSGFLLGLGFVISLALTLFSWIVLTRDYCTGHNGWVCVAAKSVAYTATAAFVGAVFSWLTDIISIRGWCNTHVTIKTNNGDTTQISLMKNDEAPFREELELQLRKTKY